MITKFKIKSKHEYKGWAISLPFIRLNLIRMGKYFNLKLEVTNWKE